MLIVVDQLKVSFSSLFRISSPRKNRYFDIFCTSAMAGSLLADLSRMGSDNAFTDLVLTAQGGADIFDAEVVRPLDRLFCQA